MRQKVAESVCPVSPAEVPPVKALRKNADLYEHVTDSSDNSPTRRFFNRLLT
jgi:hypothetical protein